MVLFNAIAKGIGRGMRLFFADALRHLDPSAVGLKALFFGELTRVLRTCRDS